MDDRDPKKFCTNCRATNEGHALACWSCGSELNTKCAGPGCGMDLTIPGTKFHHHEGWTYCDDCHASGWRRALPPPPAVLEALKEAKPLSRLMYEAQRYTDAYARDYGVTDETTLEAIYAQHLAYLIRRETE